MIRSLLLITPLLFTSASADTYMSDPEQFSVLTRSKPHICRWLDYQVASHREAANNAELGDGPRMALTVMLVQRQESCGVPVPEAEMQFLDKYWTSRLQ